MSELELLFSCQICFEKFTSRNKLFIHLRNCKIDDNTSKTLEEQTITLDDSTPLKICYEDKFCRAIIKPQGLPTMCSKGSTLLNNDILLLQENFKPGIRYRKAMPCHRLDSATGGIVICSKSSEAETILRYYFRNKLIRKRYRAIVAGKLQPQQGIIKSYLWGKLAITCFKVIFCDSNKQYGFISTLDLWPITGKRHQLRRHLKQLGHPIIGDKKYTFASQWPKFSDKMFLWALELSFPNPEYFPSHLIHNLQFDNQVDEEDIDIEEETENKINSHENNLDELTSIEIITDQPLEGYLKLPSNLDSIPKITITVDEPKYFENFRAI